MKNFRFDITFTIPLSAYPEDRFDDLMDRFSATCNDAMFQTERKGFFWAQFSREADSLSEAIYTAIKQLERTVEGLKFIRVEPHYPLSESEHLQ